MEESYSFPQDPPKDRHSNPGRGLIRAVETVETLEDSKRGTRGPIIDRLSMNYLLSASDRAS